MLRRLSLAGRMYTQADPWDYLVASVTTLQDMGKNTGAKPRQNTTKLELCSWF